MDYQKHYNLLIEKALNRPKPNCYVESHHIIPRCLGGSNAKSNLVYLTFREHFIAHLLLHKIHPNHVGLAIAISRMIGNTYNSNRSYDWIKKDLSKIYSEFHSKNAKKRWKNLDYRKEMSQMIKNKWKNPKHVQNMINKNLGRNNPNYGKTLSKDARLKISKKRSFKVWESILIKPPSKLGPGIFNKGKFIGEFDLISEFRELYPSILINSIMKCLNKKAPQSRGFIFEYSLTNIQDISSDSI